MHSRWLNHCKLQRPVRLVWDCFLFVWVLMGTSQENALCFPDSLPMKGLWLVRMEVP